MHYLLVKKIKIFKRIMLEYQTILQKKLQTNDVVNDY